jgi:hypothetical protein
MIQEPYIEETEVIVHRKYNPNYGNDRLCNCGHVYYRHFDSYDNMANVGCKYCRCHDFKEFLGDFEVVRKYVQDNDPVKYRDLLDSKQMLKEMHKMEEDEAHKVFLESCLEAHHEMSQKILNPLLGVSTWKEGDPHPQDIDED